MCRTSILSFLIVPILGVLPAACLAQTPAKVVPDATAPDSTTPGATPDSSAPNSPAERTPTQVLADPKSTPAERKAAVAEIRASAAARRAAAKERLDAARENFNKLDSLEPTTFTPDHETLNKFSYRAMFQVDAYAALQQALDIQSRTTRPTITADETAMLQSLHSGQAGKYTFAEEALIASGVSNAAKRKKYLAKIDEIVATAKQETDKRKRIEAKADAICSTLRAGPMKSSYDENAFSLGQLLDDGHYSCVSSCALFVIVAHGVGLDAGAVVQPGHIVARVPGYDVQTTSGRIYRSVPFRLEEIQDAVKKDKGLLTKFDPNHPYHEVGDSGILFEIYQNIANHARDNKQPDQAAIGALKEACFDPTTPGGGQDLKVFLNDWFNASTTRRDATTAAALAQLYRKMARDLELADDMDKCVVNLKRQLGKH